MSKKSRFRGPFNKQHSKLEKTLFKSSWKHLYRIYWSLARKLCSKMSLFLICQIFGPLVNTLVADERYHVPNRDDLIVAIQIQLCQKQKTSEDSSRSSMVNVSSYFWNLHHSTFIIFIDHCQVHWVGKISLIDMINLATAF